MQPIDKSERLSKLLRKEGIPHNVLNAKNHEQEAEIVAQAGKWGAVTVATNMAGRGTDIMLGGNAEFLAKTDLREMGYTDELIAEATGYAETHQYWLPLGMTQLDLLNDGLILGILRLIYDVIIILRTASRSTRRKSRGKQRRFGVPEDSSSSARNVTTPAGSIISCGAGPDGRGIPGRPGFT